MKRIKKYVKPKEEKAAEPKPIIVQLPSRFWVGIHQLFEISPNLKEVEANLRAGHDGTLYFFHERDLKLLYTKYRDGEIDIRYIRKWFKLFTMVGKHIALWKHYAYYHTMLELRELANTNLLTRKNFMELNRTLFLRIDKAEQGIWLR